MSAAASRRHVDGVVSRSAVSLMWEIVACGGFNIETLVGLSVLTVGAPSTRKFKDRSFLYKHNLERLKEKDSERNATEEAATPDAEWRSADRGGR